MKKALMILTVSLLAGCATKQYPQSPAMTVAEADAFQCKDVEVELVKAESIKREIESTGQFDGRTVLGFLGDFGIGNGLAKADASEKVNARIQQLQAIKPMKCQQK